MLTAISRYGARVVPDTEAIVERAKARGEFIQGPHIAEFERAFERRAGGGIAISTAYGRSAFYHILKAIRLPAGSEIIVPSLTIVLTLLAYTLALTVTSWRIEELAGVAANRLLVHLLVPACWIVAQAIAPGFPTSRRPTPS